MTEVGETHQHFSLRPFGEGVYSVVVPAGVSDRAEQPTLEDSSDSCVPSPERDSACTPTLVVSLRGCHAVGRAVSAPAGAAGRRSPHASIRPPAGRASTWASRMPSTSAGNSRHRSAAGRRKRCWTPTMPTSSGRLRRAGRHSGPDGTAVHRTRPAGGTQAAHRADGLRRGEPLSHREDRPRSTSATTRRGSRPARPPVCRYRGEAAPPLRSAASRPRTAPGPHPTPGWAAGRTGSTTWRIPGPGGRSMRTARADGHVAWIGDVQRDLDDHLSRWFGKPRPLPGSGSSPLG